MIEVYEGLRKHFQRTPEGTEHQFWKYWAVFFAIPILPVGMAWISTSDLVEFKRFAGYLWEGYAGYAPLATGLWILSFPVLFLLDEGKRRVCQVLIVVVALISTAIVTL